MNFVEYAPILITVYDRLDHLKKCIESILRCSNVGQTDLYVASDFAYRTEDIPKILAIREYVLSIRGFKSVNLVDRTSNVGSFNNFLLSINQLFQIYPKIIFLEDDNIVAPSFIDYMNLSLNLHQNNYDIFSISGYLYPINLKNIKLESSTFKWTGFSAWGVGLWKSKWEVINWDEEYMRNIFSNPRFIFKAMKISNHVLPILYYSLRTGRKVGDAIITINLIEKNMFSVFPTISLVRNIGNDGLGESRKNSQVFIDQDIDLFATIKPSHYVCSNEKLNMRLYQYFEMNILDKIKFYSRVFISNFKHCNSV